MLKGRKQKVSERGLLGLFFFLKFRSIIGVKKYTMNMIHTSKAVML